MIVGGSRLIVGGSRWVIGCVRVCDQGSRLICERGVWSVGGSVISSLWGDWRGSIAVCLRIIVRRTSIRRWGMVVRNLLYFLEEPGGN